jgi:hypothetical protein
VVWTTGWGGLVTKHPRVDRRTFSLCAVRNDWIPLSASALVVGAMSLVFGSLLNPADSNSTAAETLRVVDQDGARWLAMAVMYFFASVALIAGLPSVLTLFVRRGRRLGLTGVAVFMIGALGTCGYAMLMVFFRALVFADTTRASALDDVTADRGLSIFLQGWVAGFYGGILLIAVALLRSRTTATWVPWALVGFVAAFPVSSHIGRVGAAVQILVLAAAFTGIAMAAVTGDSRARMLSRPAH